MFDYLEPTSLAVLESKSGAIFGSLQVSTSAVIDLIAVSCMGIL